MQKVSDEKNVIVKKDLARRENSRLLLHSMAFVQNRYDEERSIKRRQMLINVLIAMFGVSAWIGVNGIYVQLPLLVTTAPEGWSLPASIVITIQAANIGPILYALVRKFTPQLYKESMWISGLLILGSAAMGFLAFFYETRTEINGVEHSLVLLSLVFANALVGCSSSILFLPYLRNFQDVQLVWFFIGEGLSGLLPSAVALIQGVGGDPPCPNPASNSTGDHQSLPSMPYFSPKIYFIFLFIVLASSTCAFWVLEYLRVTDRHQTIPTFSVLDDTSTSTHIYSTRTLSSDETSDLESPLPSQINTTVSSQSDQSNTRSCTTRYYLYVLIGLISLGGNGFLPGMQSYSCLPYGNVAYHLTVTLAHLSNPVACTLALWLPLPGPRLITGIATIALATASHVTWLAFSSPTPPWRDTKIGIVLVVLAWIILMGLITYAKLSITAIFKREPGARSLFYVGITTQIGSTIGAILSFSIINYTNLLVPYSACGQPPQLLLLNKEYLPAYLGF